MQPLSFGRSKAMLPFLARPLLHYLFSLLRTAGLTDITVSSEGRGLDIRNYFGNGEQYGLNIGYMPPENWSGSAAVVGGWIAQRRTDLPTTLLVIYGDSLLQMDFGSIIAEHRLTGANVSIVTHRTKFENFLFRDDQRCTNYGVIDVNPTGIVERFVEKPLLTDIKTLFRDPWANAAVYAFDRAGLDRILMRGPKESDFGRHFFPALLNAEPAAMAIHAIDIENGYRVDVGTIDLYLSAQIAALKGLIKCEPDFTVVGSRAWCDSTAHIDQGHVWSSPAVVGPYARIGAGVRLDHSIICAKAVIEPSAIIDQSVILDGARIGRGATIRRSIVGFNCHLGNGAPPIEDAILGELSELSTKSKLMSDNHFLGLLGASYGGRPI